MSCTAVRPTAHRTPAGRAAPTRPDARIGDAERERTGTRLGQAFAQGYLTLPEYEARLDTALAARTADVLHAVLADLPLAELERTDPVRVAARRAAARLGVRLHLAAYLAGVLVVLAVWTAVALTTGAGYFWPVWPILGGAIGLASHVGPVAAALRPRAS